MCFVSLDQISQKIIKKLCIQGNIQKNAFADIIFELYINYNLHARVNWLRSIGDLSTEQ